MNRKWQQKLLIVFVMFCSSQVLAIAQPYVDPWRLGAYQAMVDNDLTVCAEDNYCLDHVRYYRSVVCVADLCEEKGSVIDKTSRIAECAPNYYAQYSVEQQIQINTALCLMLKTPSATTRQVYLSYVVDEGEDEAVELGGYLMALRGSPDACIDYIKGYVGPYGSRWSFAWYRALSGCRILAKQRQTDDEENDFYVWMQAVQGKANCVQIKNIEMRRACNAREAASPEPVYDQLW